MSEREDYERSDEYEIKMLKKENKVMREALESVSKSLEWYLKTFNGPQHEFEHYWRVELPHEVSEALAQIISKTGEISAEN